MSKKKKRISKILNVGLIFIVILTGCTNKEAGQSALADNQDSASPVAEDTTGTSNPKEDKKKVDPADYPAFVPLNVDEDEEGGTYQMTVQGSVDLDFDGVEEELYFEGDYMEYVDEAFELVPGVFKINGKVIDLQQIITPLKPWVPEEDLGDDGYYDTIVMSMELIDLDPTDDRRELLIYKTFFLPEITFFVAEAFHYDKGTFTSLGEIDTGYQKTLYQTMYINQADIDQTNQTISLDIDDYYFCNFYRKAMYQMKNRRIKDITPKEMPMYLLDDQAEEESIVVNAEGSVHLYAKPTDRNPVYEIQPGDEITLLSCKRDEWVKVQVTGGQTGYLKYIPDPDNEYIYHFVDDPDSSAWDIFPDLPIWG